MKKLAGHYRDFVMALVSGLLAVGCGSDIQEGTVVDGLGRELLDRGSPTNGDMGKDVDDQDRKADDSLKKKQRKSLVPVLNCVEAAALDTLVAHWGYSNPNTGSVRRKIGPKNRFAPSPDNRGQPTLFDAGAHAEVFTTTFRSHQTLTWQLDGNRAEAKQSSTRCVTGAAGAPTGGSRAGAGAGGAGGTGMGVDACSACETAPHTMPNGQPNNNCNDALMHCGSFPGVATAGPRAGTARSQLCGDEVDCIHRTKCAANQPTDCLCGPGVDPFDCFESMRFEQYTGLCKNEIVAAAESTLPADLLTRFFDPSFASGAADLIVETCDALFCANQCLGAPVVVGGSGGASAGGAGTGGNGGAGSGAAGSGGHSCSASDSCCQCELAPHTFNGNPSTNCLDSLSRCDNVQGAATAGPSAGVAKAQLCRAEVDCIHQSKCAANAVTDCLCGPGVDPFDCFTAASFNQFAGQCKNEILAAAESTLPSVLNTRFFDPDYASGVADVVIETCDQFFCVSECVGTPNTGGAGAGGAGAGGAGAGGAGAGGAGAGGAAGGESVICTTTDACCQCEKAPHSLNGVANTNCQNSFRQCDALVGDTPATSPLMPNTPKSTLCRAIVQCMHDSHCASAAPTDCLCGPDVDPFNCFNSLSFSQYTGACRDLVAAGAESNTPAELQTRFFDPEFASGAADTVIETCDQFFCADQCL